MAYKAVGGFCPHEIKCLGFQNESEQKHNVIHLTLRGQFQMYFDREVITFDFVVRNNLIDLNSNHME